MHKKVENFPLGISDRCRIGMHRTFEFSSQSKLGPRKFPGDERVGENRASGLTLLRWFALSAFANGATVWTLPSISSANIKLHVASIVC